MTAEMASPKCWSCDQPLPEGGKCPNPECSGAPAIEAKPPKITLPFCGQNENFDTSAYDSPGLSIELTRHEEDMLMRPCCKCGKQWMCDAHTWIMGSCPHCGANGSDGEGGKSYDNVFGKKSFELEPLNEEISYKKEVFAKGPTKEIFFKEYLKLKNEYPEVALTEKNFEEIKIITPPNSKFLKFMGDGDLTSLQK